jgi:hypothetical protein
MKTIGLIAVLLLSSLAFAGDDADIVQANKNAVPAFCTSILEQAKAQRDELRTPAAISGVTQPNTGLPPQLVFGVTNSLANDRKAGLTMTVAYKTCNLYAAATEAQQHLLYALPSLEKDVLRHRLATIQETSDHLDALIADNMKIVDAGNSTRPAVYALQGAKVRLDASRTAALTGIASPYVPPLSDAPIRELVASKMAAEDAAEKAGIKLAKQASWDVGLSVGAHRQLSSTSSPNSSVSPVGAYGEFSLTYNLGRHAINKHLDASAKAYDEWKNTQYDDVSNQARVLKQQIGDTIVIQEEQLKVLLSHDAEIEKNLRALDGVETSNAVMFRNELLADQLILRVDVSDVQFRIAHLKQFVADNF